MEMADKVLMQRCVGSACPGWEISGGDTTLAGHHVGLDLNAVGCVLYWSLISNEVSVSQAVQRL